MSVSLINKHDRNVSNLADKFIMTTEPIATSRPRPPPAVTGQSVVVDERVDNLATLLGTTVSTMYCAGHFKATLMPL